MDSLKKECRWCVRDKGKVPYSGVGIKGKADDKGTWLSLEQATLLLEQNPDDFAGLGLYFSARENDPNMLLCGIDIDAIGHDPNHPNPLSAELLDLFKGTYAEESPSGTGYHILCHINKNEFPFTRNTYTFYQKNPNNSIEVYISGITNRYFTYTGKKLQSFNDQVTDQTENVLYVLQHYMLRPVRTKRIKAGQQTIKHEGPALLSAEDIERRLDIIRNSVKGQLFTRLYDEGDTSGYESPSDADFALLGILVPWLEGDAGSIDIAYRGSALYKNGRDEKWDLKRGNSTYGELSIENAIELSLDPYFSDRPDYATGDTIDPTDIVQIINDVQNDEQNKDKVSVIPFACGLGKSTAISYKIAEVLQSESTDGLIIVTDSIERMYQYPAPTNTKLNSLKEYLDAHADEISVMYSKTLKVEKERQKTCKVLILATQRYFQYSTRAQIIDYTVWDKGKRPLVIIDEKPSVLESIEIMDSDFDKVSNLLESFTLKKNQEELDWCLEEWERLTRYFKEKSKRYRRLPGDLQYYFFQSEQDDMTSDDDRFMRFIDKHRKVFIENKVYGKLRGLKAMMQTWGIVQREKKGNQVKVTYNSVNDHSDKIRDIGAKVIILDGTATLSPEYDAAYFDIRDYPACRRMLNRLSINVVDVLTTRAKINASDKKKLAESIRDYAWVKNRKKEKRSVVFTYKSKNDKDDLEDELKKIFNTKERPANVDHLGALRGKNTYIDTGFIIQYGLNRCPSPFYLLHILSNDKELMDQLFKADEGAAAQILAQIANSFVYTRISNSMMLADIEQNFFRGVIRMSNRTDPEEFHLFFSLQNNHDLLYLMQLRYWPLKADIKVSLPPKEFTFLKLHDNKGPARLLRWLQDICEPGRTFTYDDIAEETGLSKQQISQIRSRHKDIDALLTAWGKNEDKGYYRKPLKKNRKVNQGL